MLSLAAHGAETVLKGTLVTLQQFWSKESIAALETQHSRLVFAYQNEWALKSTLDKCDHDTLFEIGWGFVQTSRAIQSLQDFCGGIASIFANTASVEPYFSILGWEKDEYRMTLMALSP
jgi:hypothetical protein